MSDKIGSPINVAATLMDAYLLVTRYLYNYLLKFFFKFVMWS